MGRKPWDSEPERRSSPGGAPEHHGFRVASVLSPRWGSPRSRGLLDPGLAPPIRAIGCGVLLPRSRGRLDPGLAPWAKLFRPRGPSS